MRGKSAKSVRIFIPTKPEQSTIASFLDRKTSQIDSLISKKKRMIDLLKEERAAIINHAVTKGINPDAEMKDSGVEWLGEVPGHWEVKKMKFVASLRSGNGITSDEIKTEGQYPVYGGNGLRGYTSAFTHEGRYALIGRQGALCGNINYAEGKFWASEHAVVATLLSKSNVFWFGELLRSMNLGQYSISAAQPGLAVDRIETLQIPCPSESEQTAIATYLDNKTSQIDSSITHIEKEISLIYEYRTALINETVTGKIDIRGKNV
jgi:type I restriction enzyme S subunit